MSPQQKRRNLQRAAVFVADKIGRSPKTKTSVSRSPSRTVEHTESMRMAEDNVDVTLVHSPSDESSRSDPSSQVSDFEEIDGAEEPTIEENQLKAMVPSNDDPVEGFDRLSVKSPDDHPTAMDSAVAGERSDMDVDHEHSEAQTSMGDDRFVNKIVASQPTIRKEPTSPTASNLPRRSNGNVDDTFNAERKLRYVAGRMLAPDRPHASVVSLEKSFPHEDPYELRRLRMISAFKGTSRIKNLSLCEPNSLMLIDGHYLKHSESNKDNMFYLTGIVKFTSLFDDSQNSRQVGFLPFASTWYRALSVLGSIFDMRTLHFASFQNCITMSTKTRNFNASGGQLEGLETLEEAKAKAVNVTDSWSLNVDAHVPIFDGRYRLNLNDLRESPEYCRELEPGTAVAVIFTVNSYRPYRSQMGKYHVDRSDLIVSLNIRALVLVKDAHPGFTHKQRINARELALGIEFPPVKEQTTVTVANASAMQVDNVDEDDPLAGTYGNANADVPALF